MTFPDDERKHFFPKKRVLNFAQGLGVNGLHRSKFLCLSLPYIARALRLTIYFTGKIGIYLSQGSKSNNTNIDPTK